MSWTRFFRRRHWDDERRRELDAYLDIETDDNIARGMSPGDARAAARRKLGNATLVREEIYRMNTLTRTESIWQDFRYGLRLLLRAPGFACVALVSLGLGIGANTALFHLLDAVRLRTLPVDRPHELVEIRIQPPPNGRTGSFNGRNPAMTYPLWKSLEPGLDSIGNLFIWADESFDLSLSGESRSARGLWLTGNAFESLGIRNVTNVTDAQFRLAQGFSLRGGYQFAERRIQSVERTEIFGFENLARSEQTNRLHAGTAGFRLEPMRGLSVLLDGEIGRHSAPFYPTSERDYHGLGARVLPVNHASLAAEQRRPHPLVLSAPPEEGLVVRSQGTHNNGHEEAGR